MERYIDAEKLIEEIKSLQVTVTGLHDEKGFLREIMKEYQKSVLRIVDEQPTADVVEVVRCEGGVSEFVEDGFGKTLFLIREEAEQALKGEQSHER